VQEGHSNKPAWSPDPAFYASHLWLPAVVAAGAFYALEHSGLDIWLANHWFALEGARWAWRDNWLAYGIIHHNGKQAVIVLALAVMAAWALSYRLPSLRPWRRSLAYLLACMVLLPSVVAYSKHYSPVPCPWDLDLYGGNAPYRHSLSYHFGTTSVGHCFPSGHASAGFALLAMYFAAYPHVRRPGRFLWPGLLVGWLFALGQQARGAHFLSHDLWTLAICWFGALLLFRVFRPYEGNGPLIRTAGTRP
jgi:membrane-associated PAP2 superfamily phosphatase